MHFYQTLLPFLIELNLFGASATFGEIINISKNYISLNSNLILFVICNVELKKSSRIKDP